jgi:hypothetical protein
LIPTKEDSTKKARFNNNLNVDYVYHKQVAVLDFIAKIFSAKDNEKISYTYADRSSYVASSTYGGSTETASSIVNDTLTVNWNNYSGIVNKITEIMRTFDMSFDGNLTYSSGEAITSILETDETTDPMNFRFNVGHTQDLTREERQAYATYNGDVDTLIKNPDIMQKLMQELDTLVRILPRRERNERLTNLAKEEMTQVFEKVGLKNVPDKLKKQLRERCRETKKQIETNTAQGVDEGISAITTSLQQASEFHIKQ